MNTRNHLFAAMAATLTLFLAVPGSATADVTEAQIAAAVQYRAVAAEHRELAAGEAKQMWQRGRPQA